MMERPSELQDFLDALQAAFAAVNESTSAMRDFQSSLFQSLATFGTTGTAPAANLPVCSNLPLAIQSALKAIPEVARLAMALEMIMPNLTWKVRSSSGLHASANWPDGHANAVIIGQGGLEDRTDVAIGLSLLAPRVRYPDHTHPPEELYLVLTPGQFQHGDDDWCEPGAGGTFHNAPGIKHAMASGEIPLLAIWTMVMD